MLWGNVSEAVEFELGCSHLPAVLHHLIRLCGHCRRWWLQSEFPAAELPGRFLLRLQLLTQKHVVLNLNVDQIVSILHDLRHFVLALLICLCLRGDLRLSHRTQGYVRQRRNVFIQPSFQKWLPEAFLTVIVFFAQDSCDLLSSRIDHRVSL